MTVDAPRRPVLTRLGVADWSIVGAVVLFVIVVLVLAAVSELVLPLVFAVMLGSTVYPLARRLQDRGLRPSLAALAVVVSTVAALVGVILITVNAVVHESAKLAAEFDRAIEEASTTTDNVGLSAETLENLRDALRTVAGVIGRGLLTLLVGGVSAAFGFVASSILATLIGYYVLKDGPEIKTWGVNQLPEDVRAEADSFVSGAVRVIRGYWGGRTVISALVTIVIVAFSLLLGLPLIGTIAVVNFLGGYIPYIGAFIGGGLAVLLALANGGWGPAILMLVVTLVCNLLLENLVEPRIMSGRLHIHPLMVLIATTIGGVVGGIVGLILAVPVTVVTIDLFRRLRRIGVLSAARARAEPVFREAISARDPNSADES